MNPADLQGGLNVLELPTNSQVLSADGQVPFRQVTINGVLCWQAGTGRTFPQVAGAEDPPPGDEHTEEEADDDQEFDKDRAMATLRKQRLEVKAAVARAKAAEVEAAALKKREQERADADKSELEKAQAKLAEREKAHAEAEAKLKRVLISTAIERAARKHNARSPEVVAKLIDRDALELDDEGNPTNAEQLVKDLLKAEAYLVADGRSEAGSSSGVPPTPRSSGSPKPEERVKELEQKLIETRQYTPIG